MADTLITDNMLRSVVEMQRHLFQFMTPREGMGFEDVKFLNGGENLGVATKKSSLGVEEIKPPSAQPILLIEDVRALEKVLGCRWITEKDTTEDGKGFFFNGGELCWAWYKDGALESWGYATQKEHDAALDALRLIISVPLEDRYKNYGAN